MDIVTPEIGLVFWTGIVFVILLFLLAKFAWKPILNAVNERESSIEKALRGAEEAEKRMAALVADNEAAKKEAMLERDALMKEARETRDNIVAEAKAAASSEAARVMESAREEIDIQKKAALADIKTQVAALSIEIAEKLIKKDLSSDSNQKELVNSLLAETKLN